MKDSSEYAPRLKKLYNRLKRENGSSAKMEELEPVDALIMACLTETAPETKSRTALNRLRQSYVDFNELRVSRSAEIVEILGKTFPEAEKVAQKIIAVLGEVYERRDSLDLSDLPQGSKREAKAFLESLKTTTPYISARVMLQSIGGHAFPVHRQMMDMLLKEEVVNPNADMAEVQGFLERQISASQIQPTYAVLRKHADKGRSRSRRKKKTKKKSS